MIGDCKTPHLHEGLSIMLVLNRWSLHLVWLKISLLKRQIMFHLRWQVAHQGVQFFAEVGDISDDRKLNYSSAVAKMTLGTSCRLPSNQWKSEHNHWYVRSEKCNIICSCISKNTHVNRGPEKMNTNASDLRLYNKDLISNTWR